ncbi:GCD complex subunit gcd7 [Coemansia biformis]|uniref:Translation initiation factor eIF2B subunit beta n=1 Tax=Coemansia biformis TaxID=1286918 RepID=A0A9W8CXA7_9FUNG|nr:GCD complex subunit gcd7 [Coemansia biformis]
MESPTSPSSQFSREAAIYVDGFITRLRRGQVVEAKRLAMETVNLVEHVISISRWNDVETLSELIRAVGRKLLIAQPRELLIANVICRLLRMVAEESESVKFVEDGWPAREPVREPPSVSSAKSCETPGMGLGQSGALLTRTFAEQVASQLEVESMTLQGFKNNIRNEIEEYIEELENVEANIAKSALEYIHSNEIILTCGRSRTVEQFLRTAAEKRKFHVIVTETAPTYEGHEQARALADVPNIEVVVIPDSAAFAIMSRVNKVILGTRAVMANGGLVAVSGTHMIAAAARHHSTQVVVCAGPYKYSPWFPSSDDCFNTLESPDAVLPYREGDLVAAVDVVSPRYDYVPPELVDIFVDSTGGHLPSYLYRLLRESCDEARDLSWGIHE